MFVVNACPVCDAGLRDITVILKSNESFKKHMLYCENCKKLYDYDELAMERMKRMKLDFSGSSFLDILGVKEV